MLGGNLDPYATTQRKKGVSLFDSIHKRSQEFRIALAFHCVFRETMNAVSTSGLCYSQRTMEKRDFSLAASATNCHASATPKD